MGLRQHPGDFEPEALPGMKFVELGFCLVLHLATTFIALTHV